MDKQIIANKIDTYLEDLKAEVHHNLLTRDLGEVAMRNSTAFLLLLPMLNGETWTDEMYQSALAVGAVQVAFDAHDSIHPNDATALEQQLTVLAGDYYSGIHYQLLSLIPDFVFIRELSLQIGRVYEEKSERYLIAPDEKATLQQALQIIDTSCIIQFFQHFHFEKYRPIVEIALPLVTLHAYAQGDSDHVMYEWELDRLVVEEVITSLTTELSKILDKSLFISSLLREEIELLTMPLLRKTM